MISNETVFENPISLPPKTLLGYRDNGMPIYNVAGGSVDVGTDTDDTEYDSDDSDDTDDTEEEWTPPTREDYAKLIEAKKKADSEAAARKRFLRDAGFDPKTGKPIAKPSVNTDDDDDDDDSTQAQASPGFNKEKLEKGFQRQLEREVQKAELTGRSSAYALIHEVPNALEDAGWNGKNLPRMIKLLDLDALEIDADGIDPDQLAEQVSELKKDFPEFFKRARMKEAVKEVADTGTVGGGKKQVPASEESQDWTTRLKNQIYGPPR